MEKFRIPIREGFEKALFVKYDGRRLVESDPRLYKKANRSCFCEVGCRECKCFSARRKLKGICECIEECRVIAENWLHTKYLIGFKPQDPRVDEDLGYILWLMNPWGKPT